MKLPRRQFLHLAGGAAALPAVVILGSVFFALGGVAALGLAENHWR
jgi:hypothetical protein